MTVDNVDKANIAEKLINKRNDCYLIRMNLKIYSLTWTVCYSMYTGGTQKKPNSCIGPMDI